MADVLQKFKKRFLSGGFLMGSNKERREFLRFETRGFKNVYLQLPQGQKVPIDNISYGGFSVRDTGHLKLPDKKEVKKTLEAEVVCFNLKHSFSFNVVNARGKQLGLEIVHSDMSGLLWLRGILEFFRIGLALVLNEEKAGKPGKPGKPGKITIFKGQSASNLKITRDEKGEIERLDLSFVDKEISSKVEYLDDEIIYRRFDDLDDDSFLALQQGFFIIAGLVQANALDGMKELFLLFEKELLRVYDPKLHDLAG